MVHSESVLSQVTWFIYIKDCDRPYDSYSYTTAYSCPQNAKAGYIDQ